MSESLLPVIVDDEIELVPRLLDFAEQWTVLVNTRRNELTKWIPWKLDTNSQKGIGFLIVMPAKIVPSSTRPSSGPMG